MAKVFLSATLWICGLSDMTLTGVLILDFIDGNSGDSGFLFNVSPFLLK